MPLLLLQITVVLVMLYVVLRMWRAARHEDKETKVAIHHCIEYLAVENTRDRLDAVIKSIPPVGLVSEVELRQFWTAPRDWQTETTAVLRDLLSPSIVEQYER